MHAGARSETRQRESARYTATQEDARRRAAAAVTEAGAGWWARAAGAVTGALGGVVDSARGRAAGAGDAPAVEVRSRCASSACCRLSCLIDLTRKCAVRCLLGRAGPFKSERGSWVRGLRCLLSSLLIGACFAFFERAMNLPVLDPSCVERERWPVGKGVHAPCDSSAHTGSKCAPPKVTWGVKWVAATMGDCLETGRGRHMSTVSSSPCPDTLHAELVLLACMSLMQGPAARRWAGGSARGPRPTRAAPPSRWSAPWCRSACMRWGARPAPKSRAWAGGGGVQGVRANPSSAQSCAAAGSRGVHEVYLVGSHGARTGHQD